LKRNQRTIKSSFEMEGVGLHTGTKVRVKVSPADAGTGLLFNRVDLPEAPPIAASFRNIVDNPRRTTLRNGNAEVNTVEHFCAAMMGLAVDNLEVDIDGPEMPGLDGSARPIVDQIQAAGIVEQRAPARTFDVQEPITIVEREGFISLTPSDHEGLSISYTLDYPGSAIGSQFFSIDVKPESFAESLAPARTFCFEGEVEELRKRGLGLGANYSNTLVIGSAGVLQNQLRFDNEFARHKALDLLGDLFLAGFDLRGRVIAAKTGHHANQRLVGRLVELIEAQEAAGLVVHPTGMEIKEILSLLPHRYPFLLIDRVIELQGYRRAVGIKNVTINEPFFQGHWPGQPIMPGVLILEAMAQLAGLLLLRRLENTGKLAVLWSIDEVKLRRAVVPGDQLRIEIEATKIRSKLGQGRAVARVGPHKVAEALLTFTLVDATG